MLVIIVGICAIKFGIARISPAANFPMISIPLCSTDGRFLPIAATYCMIALPAADAICGKFVMIPLTSFKMSSAPFCIITGSIGAIPLTKLTIASPAIVINSGSDSSIPFAIFVTISLPLFKNFR